MANKKSTKRRVLITAGIVVAALIVLGVVGRVAGFFGGTDGIGVEISEADERTITQTVTAFGRTQPEVEVTISPDVSGEIVQLAVREGDPVRQGELLARIQPDNYESQVKQAQARLNQARATKAQRRADLLQAERQYERQKQLHEREAISESELEEAETNYEVAKANHESATYEVENAEAQLEEAEKQLERTEIYAPMDGTISRLDVESGERVVGTAQQPGTEMMRIARLDQMELEIDVNENDIVNVSERDTASIEIDAYPDRSFQGVVTEIANSARVEDQGGQQQVTNFPVKVRVLDRHNTNFAVGSTGPEIVDDEMPLVERDTPIFRPGMSGTVDIFTQTVENAVAVPIQAVTTRDVSVLHNPDDGASEGEAQQREPREEIGEVVFVAEADSARMVEVSTGIADDTHIEITSGLEGGERVIIGPYRAVSRELEHDTKIREETPGPAAMRQ